MIALKYIRENKELVKEGIINKNCSIDIDSLLESDLKRREIIQKKELLQSNLIKANELMGQKKERGKIFLCR